MGFIEKGSLWVAQTSGRLHTLKRQYSTTNALGIDCALLRVRIMQVCYVEEILTEKQRFWIRERGFQTLPSVRIPTQPYGNLIYMFTNGVPDTFHYSLLPDNWDNFPESECETLITGADSFTLNGRLIMNESAEINNYFVATGSNGHGIALVGVVYGEVLGYERPLFLKPDEARKKDFEDISKQDTFGVAVIDMTSFKKYELKSANRSVVDFLQMHCVNNIDKPIGTVVHREILNEQTGHEKDCSVIRLREYHFLLVSLTLQSNRNMKWLKTHVLEDDSIFLSDVTSLYTALNVIGSKAKHVLSDLSDENFYLL
ncbi:unnamed protein product [Adineta steineri]|uniref:GCVT N-terminal domain-containing protein n=1 Tax=Adineta steineri TaxID=433720 RepID=A0A813TD52_9BILA|nr:unnamed protein product [Adineta steineri]